MQMWLTNQVGNASGAGPVDVRCARWAAQSGWLNLSMGQMLEREVILRKGRMEFAVWGMEGRWDREQGDYVGCGGIRSRVVEQGG